MLGFFRQNITDYLRANVVSYFFITLILVIGVVIGALAIKTLPEDQKGELVNYLSVLFHRLNSPNGYSPTDSHSLFLSLVLNNIKTAGLMWLLGFTIVGIPFVLFIIFTRGFVIGFTVGFLIDEYVAKGLMFALASVLPHNFIAMPALLIIGVSATSFSFALVKRRMRGKSNLLYESIGYTAVCFSMLVLLVLAAAIEAYVSPVFMKLVAGLLVNN